MMYVYCDISQTGSKPGDMRWYQNDGAQMALVDMMCDFDL